MDDRILAVQRMQDYIEAHLHEQISLGELARVSLFSPWYAHRLFTQMTGSTPAEYIRRWRLSESALRLRDEGCTVTEVAFAMGFGSVDGYQRAFFREFGCNPREYAVDPRPIYLFTPYGVRYRAMETRESMDKTKTVFVSVQEKPARKVIIKRGQVATDYFAYCGEVGCDVWGLLVSMCDVGQEPVSMWLPEHLRMGASEYVQGVEVPADYAGTVPEGLDVIALPAATYLRFQGEPFAEEDYCTAIQEIWEAIASYDPKNVGYAWDGANPRIQLEPRGERGYIELVAVKR